MILKNLRLENIRSYENAEVAFPLGTTVLSGDIGTGKSTILLAIEFCLFGIQRGELGGKGILRHGAKSGSIELTIKIANKEIQIKRILKRGQNNSITQDPGFIVIDDVPKQLSPTEIKQKVIELLGYPQEVLTKKSPIFRYTVYTPQEEMKTILIADKESRIDTLRKVFDIDKYKVIRSNAQIILQELKSKRKEFASMIYDLEDKKELTKVKTQKIAELEIEKTRINIGDIKQRIDKIKYSIIQVEENIKNFNDLKQNLAIKNEKLTQLIILKKKNNEILENKKQKLAKTETTEKSSFSSEQIKQERWKYEDTIKAFEEKAKEAQAQIVKFRTNKEASNELKEKILKLNKCPTCLQNVAEDHKKSIIETEVQKINVINQELEKMLHQERDIQSVIKSAKSKLEYIQIEENKLRVQELINKESIELKEEIKKLEEEQSNIKKEMDDLNEEKVLIEEKLKTIDTIEIEYNLKKEELSKLQEEERKISIEFATKDKEISLVQEEITLLNKEIKTKEVIKRKLERYSSIQDWIENTFINLMIEVEKTVMLRIKQEFDQLLQQWFNLLIEDENINISIDEEFTPKLEQDGHDTEYEFLSGGERTAAALAYRLALNQTINNVISKIKTKDIIILDEPTEGFSSVQIEKLREVLTQLKVKQIILVSHESQIESFVENIIRIQKENNKSTVAYN